MSIQITLYHTSHCPNCHAQEKILEQLKPLYPSIDLKLINLEQNQPIPDLSPPIQAVPTLFIDRYRFEGLLSLSEVKQWLQPGNHDQRYIQSLLKAGQLDLAKGWLQQHPDALTCLVDLLDDDNLELTVRLGIDTLLEQLVEVMDVSSLTQPLGKLLETSTDTLCIDILYYLAMIGSAEARLFIQSASQRQHPEVQRVAKELLSEFDSHLLH